MQEIFWEFAIKIPANQCTFMIACENQELLEIEAAAHDVGLMVLNRIICWIVLA